MALSCRDRDILNKFEEFGGLTITQIAFQFFPKGEHNYDYARLRLSKLLKMGVIKRTDDVNTKKKIYYVGDKKPEISLHRMILIDFYSYLIYEGFKVIDYKFEYRWMNGKYYSDGVFLIEDSKGIQQVLIVEVDFTHKTNLSKYEKIYESNEAQEKFGFFPNIFIINYKGNEYKLDESSIINDYLVYIDMDLKLFNRVLGVIC